MTMADAAVENWIGKTRNTAGGDPRGLRQREEVDVVARMALALQEADTFETCEPTGTPFPMMTRTYACGYQLLGGVALATLAIADLGDCPDRNRRAVGHDEVGAGRGPPGIAAARYRIECSHLAKHEDLTMLIRPTNWIGVGNDRQDFGLLATQLPEGAREHPSLGVPAGVVEQD